MLFQLEGCISLCRILNFLINNDIKTIMNQIDLLLLID